jgi:hypothetical protein
MLVPLIFIDIILELISLPEFSGRESICNLNRDISANALRGRELSRGSGA